MKWAWPALLIGLVVILAAALTSRPGEASPPYGQRTGQPCSTCHIGVPWGALSPQGLGYRAGGYRWPPPPTPTAPLLSLGQPLRAMLRWVHFAALIAWLGSIGVVHLVLSPKITQRGIPPRFLRLAWPAMALVFLTGGLLALGQVSSWQSITVTPWGNFLGAKVLLFLVMVGVAAYETLSLSPALRRRTQEVEQTPATPQAVAEGDGSPGKPVLVMVQGMVYDLSTSPAWRRGLHIGEHRAGQDLTEALAQAPHGPEMLARFPCLTCRVEEDPLYRRLWHRHRQLTWAVLVLGALALWAATLGG